MKKKKQQQFSIFLILVVPILILVGWFIFRRKKENPPHHGYSKKDDKGGNTGIPEKALILNLDKNNNLGNLDGNSRRIFADMYDRLIEGHKWQEVIPEIPVEPHWQIQPQVARHNVLMRMNVTSKNHAGTVVSVLLDGYGIITDEKKTPHWQVSTPSTPRINIPMNDIEGLKAAINDTFESRSKAMANTLNHSSPENDVTHDDESTTDASVDTE